MSARAIRVIILALATVFACAAGWTQLAFADSLSMSLTELSPGAGATVTPGEIISYRILIPVGTVVGGQTNLTIRDDTLPSYATLSWQGGGTDTNSAGASPPWWIQYSAPNNWSGYVDFNVTVQSSAPNGSALCTNGRFSSDQVPWQNTNQVCNLVSNSAAATTVAATQTTPTQTSSLLSQVSTLQSTLCSFVGGSYCAPSTTTVTPATPAVPAAPQSPSLSTPTPVPATPTNLSYSCNASGTQATLTWSDPDTTIAAYNFNISTTTAYSLAIPATSNGVVSASIPVTPGTTYEWDVSAENAAGTSALSPTPSFVCSVARTPAPQASAFTVGERVQTTAALNVRASASINGTLLGTQANGALGTIVSGPTPASGYNWWQVNFDAAPSGWSVENYLQQAPQTTVQNPSSPATTPSAACGVLATNATLTPGQSIVSCNGTYTLIFQTDGNVVLYPTDNETISGALWSTQTNGKPAATFVMQSDGNLVLYDANNNSLWGDSQHGGTIGQPGTLTVGNSGNLEVTMAGGMILWSSGTGQSTAGQCSIGVGSMPLNGFAASQIAPAAASSLSMSDLASIINEQGPNTPYYEALPLTVTENGTSMDMDVAKIVQAPAGSSYPYLAVFHHQNGVGFDIDLAYSTDLITWHFLGTMASGEEGDPDIRILPDGSVLIAFEAANSSGTNPQVRYYASVAALATQPAQPAAMINLPMVPGNSNDGTPDFGTISYSGNIYNCCSQPPTAR